MHSTPGRGRDCQPLDSGVLANKESASTRSAISVPQGCWLRGTEFPVGTGPFGVQNGPKWKDQYGTQVNRFEWSLRCFSTYQASSPCPKFGNYVGLKLAFVIPLGTIAVSFLTLLGWLGGKTARPARLQHKKTSRILRGCSRQLLRTGCRNHRTSGGACVNETVVATFEVGMIRVARK